MSDSTLARHDTVCSTQDCRHPAVVFYVPYPGPQQAWGDKKRPVCQECMDALTRGKGRGMFEAPEEPGVLFYSYADRPEAGRPQCKNCESSAEPSGDRCRDCNHCVHCGRRTGLEYSDGCRWTDCPSNPEQPS